MSHAYVHLAWLWAPAEHETLLIKVYDVDPGCVSLKDFFFGTLLWNRQCYGLNSSISETVNMIRSCTLHMIAYTSSVGIIGES